MESYNVYAIGQTVLLEAFNTNDEGDPESPDSPQILLRDPTGAETSLAVTEAPTGHVFHQYRVVADPGPGLYHYRIVTADDAIERFFQVRASAFATPLP